MLKRILIRIDINLGGFFAIKRTKEELFMFNAIVSTENMSLEEWRRFRNTGIGGSDVATICGLNKYKSAFQLWAEKTSTYTRVDSESEPAYWGSIMEPIIRNEFCKRTGLEVSVHKAIF